MILLFLVAKRVALQLLSRIFLSYFSYEFVVGRSIRKLKSESGSVVGQRATSSRENVKVEKILKGILDSILSPSPLVKIQIMGRKVCLRCKGKKLLGIVNKLLKSKSLLTSPSNVLPYYLK